MSTWDATVFARPANEEFLDDLMDLEDEDVAEAIRDAIYLVARQPHVSEDEEDNGLAAATIAAIWAGAPFSASEVAETYPFIRSLVGTVDEELSELAAELLENVDTEEDVDQFIEALS